MRNKEFLVGMLVVLLTLTVIPFSSDHVKGCCISNPNLSNHKLSILDKEGINGGLLIKISGVDCERDGLLGYFFK